MKRTLLSVVLLVALLCPVQLSAQKASIQNIKEFYSKNISAIKENNEIKGYIAFYPVDRKNSKENNYKLTIWDANLSLKYDIDLLRPATTKFIEASFNGKYFCVSFFDFESKKISYLIYDQDGKQSGTYDVEAPLMRIISYTNTGETVSYMVGLPDVGFAHYGLDNKGKNAIVDVVDNEGKKIWSATYTGDDKNDHVMAYPYANNEEILASLVGIRESKFSLNVKKMYIRFHDPKTGKDLFTFENRRGNYQYSFLKVKPEGDKIHIYGEYFGLKENPFTDESTGMFVVILDKKGNVLDEKYISWSDDIQKTMPAAIQTAKGQRLKLVMHDVVKTADNKYFIIGEQFGKNVDGLGIASDPRKDVSPKYALYNLVILEMDQEFSFVKGNIIKKTASGVLLPAGLSLYGSSLITYYLKTYGEFDYCFTNESVDKKTFSTIYISYENDGRTATSIIGAASYNKDQQLVEDKLVLTPRPTFYIALPAKAGYVTIFEYFEETKTVNIRMEKLNI